MTKILVLFSVAYLSVCIQQISTLSIPVAATGCILRKGTLLRNRVRGLVTNNETCTCTECNNCMLID